MVGVWEEMNWGKYDQFCEVAAVITGVVLLVLRCGV